MFSFKKDLKYLVIFLLIFLLCLQIYSICADPPGGTALSDSFGPFGDEARYSHYSRNMVLFGTWSQDENKHYLIMPVHSLLLYLSFSIFGIGYPQARCVSVILGLISILLIYLIVRKDYSEKTAVLSATMLATDYFYIMYSRLALLEISLIAFMILSIYLFQLGIKQKTYIFLSGLSYSFACLIKPTALVLLPVFGAGFVYLSREIKENGLQKTLLRVMVFLSGLFVSAVLYYFFVVNSASIADVKYAYSIAFSGKFPAKLIEKMVTFLTFSSYWAFYKKELLITGLGFLYSFLFLLIKEYRVWKFTNIIFWAWLFCDVIFLASATYRPIRYHLILIPPLCVLTAIFLFSERPEAKNQHISWGEKVLGSFWIAFLLNGFIFEIGRKISPLSEMYLNRASSLISIFILITLLNFFAMFRIKKIIMQFLDFVAEKRFQVIGVFVSVYLAMNGARYISWIYSLKYDMLATANEIETIIGDCIVAGEVTHIFKSKAYIIPVYEKMYNDETFLKNFKVKFLLLDDKQEEFMYRKYSDIMQKATHIKQFLIKGPYIKKINLYRL